MDRQVALVDCIDRIDQRGHCAQCAANRSTAVSLGELSSRGQRQTVSAQLPAGGDGGVRTLAQDLCALHPRLLGAEEQTTERRSIFRRITLIVADVLAATRP